LKEHSDDRSKKNIANHLLAAGLASELKTDRTGFFLIPAGLVRPKRISSMEGKTKEENLYYGFHALRHSMADYPADKEKVNRLKNC